MLDFVQSTYDQIADRYDDLWTPHVAEPQARLTELLALRRGERVVDLACGTGACTVEMLKAVSPGETVGIDTSEEMLRAATARARALELPLTTIAGDGATVLAGWAPRSIDVLSMRFCLAYLEWRRLLPSWAPLLRPGGRVGILTSLATSTPQAWTIYCEMQDEMGLPPAQPNTPHTVAEVTGALEQGGLTIASTFLHGFRIWYPSGAAAAAWLRESGFATHPAVAEIAPQALEMLLQLFGGRLERFREDRGVPLDFEVAGIVAVTGGSP